MAKSKNNPRIKVKIEEVSTRSFLGRKSQMDKTIEKYRSQGWKLTGRRKVPDKKNHYKLQFKYRMSDADIDAEKRRKRNLILGLVGVVLVCTVFFCLMGMLGQRVQNEEATQDAILQATLIVMEQATNEAQSTADMYATQTATLWTLTPSPTAIPSNTPTITIVPTDASLVFVDENGTQFVIEGVIFLPETQQAIPSNGAILILMAQLVNTSNGSQCVTASNLRLILDGIEYAPDTRIMNAVKPMLTPQRDFVGAFTGHCVSAGEQEPTFVAFDVPRNATNIELRFDSEMNRLDFVWSASAYPVGEIVTFDRTYSLATQYVEQQATRNVAATMTATLWTATPTLAPTATQAFSQQIEAAVNNAAVFRTESLVNDIINTVQVVFGTSQNSANLDLFEIFCAVQPVIVDTGYSLRLVGEITEYNRILMTISNGNIPTVDCSNYQVIDWQAIADIEYSVPSNISLSGQSLDTTSVIPTQPPIQSGTTYYANDGEVRLRECPNSNDCSVVDVLQQGQAITVFERVEGSEFRGSTEWFRAEHNGREVYVHTALVQPNPVATDIPVQPQTSSSQNESVACDCNSGDTLNCGDFSRQSAAQACHNQCVQEVGRDVHELDGSDGDGLACESLP